MVSSNIQSSVLQHLLLYLILRVRVNVSVDLL